MTTEEVIIAIVRVLGSLPVEEIRKITHENAAHVYRHPLPKVCIP